MTPAEIALAKVLAAWDAWPGIGGSIIPLPADEVAMSNIGSVLVGFGLLADDSLTRFLTDKGRDLIARAKAEGHLT